MQKNSRPVTGREPYICFRYTTSYNIRSLCAFICVPFNGGKAGVSYLIQIATPE